MHKHTQLPKLSVETFFSRPHVPYPYTEMPSQMNTPLADAQKKRVLADVTNHNENLPAPVTCEEELKKPKLSHQVSSSIIDKLEDFAERVVVISLDGNIGAGKSTLLDAVAKALPEVEVVVEPVGTLGIMSCLNNIAVPGLNCLILISLSTFYLPLISFQITCRLYSFSLYS